MIFDNAITVSPHDVATRPACGFCGLVGDEKDNGELRCSRTGLRVVAFDVCRSWVPAAEREGAGNA